MGEARSTEGREEKCTKNEVGNLTKTDHLRDQGVDGRIILKLL
jgi:hypothetical protein